MSLQPGQSLLHYSIVEKIGEGGMGVVFKGRDTTLDREVAIKVLPALLTDDPERMARLDREAKLLAAVNHPNIATVHGLHDAQVAGGRVRFLVMELVEGESLASRLARGRLSVEEALGIGIRVARALQTAHDKGIIHRDLKPGNIQVAADGAVKVLDFGLAKVAEPAQGGPDPASASLSPTLTTQGTLAGAILGTAAYMSPEQARGRPVDRRADLWALGVVLYEMLAGRPAFPGEDVAEVLAGVIRGTPDWNAIPAELPGAARTALRGCLARKPEDRFGDASAVRILLEEALEPRDEAAAAGPGAAPRSALLPWALLGVTLIAAAVGLWIQGGGRRDLPPPQATVRFHIPLPGEGSFRGRSYLDVTPDGRTILYSGFADGEWGLFVRDLERSGSRMLPGTEGAEGPFVSADGERIGFAAGGKLKQTTLGGLRPRAVADLPDAFRGGAWTPDGSIIYTPDFDSGLWRVTPGGSAPEVLTTPDREAGETTHFGPHVLPTGTGVVFQIRRGLAEGGRDEVALLSLETGAIETLLTEAAGPIRYVDTGHLLMLREGQLVALPFDVRSLKVTGKPARLFENAPISGEAEQSIVQFAVSAQGTLVYSAVRAFQPWELVWVERDGEERPASAHRQPFAYPTLSPDGRQIAVGHDDQIWVYEADGEQRVRLTLEGSSYVPLWSPDGERILFGSYRPAEDLYWMRADGRGTAELLLEHEHRQYPAAWHEPTDLLVLQWVAPSTGYDIWTLSMTEPREARPFLESRYNERWPSLSPDGRWIAFASDETGRSEIYVRSFPDGGNKRAVSSQGGVEPRWSPTGREIFFKTGGGEMAGEADLLVAAVDAEGSTLRFGPPRHLFGGDYLTAICCGHSYDVTADGETFIMTRAEEHDPQQINVVLNALASLRPE